MEIETSRTLIEALRLRTKAMAPWQSGLVWQLARQVLTEQRPLQKHQAEMLLHLADLYLDEAILAECRGQQRLFD